MTNNLLLPIVIIYQEDYHDSNIYKSLLYKYDHLHIILYDNSPTPVNQKYSSQYIHYFHNPDNGGVTVGYNKGADFGASNLNVEYIVLLDQDTQFEENYLEKLSIEISRKAYDLYAPVIKTRDNNPCSPVKVTPLSIKGIDIKPGIIPLSEYKPINSGACIRLASFMKVGGYNENIKLDFADFDFFERLNATVSNYMIVDSVAYQSFSNEEKNPTKLFGRFKQYIHDAIHFDSSHSIWFIVLKHTLALTLRTKNLHFFVYYISNYIFRK